MKSNIERLGDAYARRMKKTAIANTPVGMELGIINGNMSLSVDSLQTPIPKGDYMVALELTHKNYFSYNEMNSSAAKPHHHEGGEHGGHIGGTGFHTHDDGLHDHRAPSVFRNLKPGDRVLVAWAGKEPVVICIVVSSDTVTEN